MDMDMYGYSDWGVFFFFYFSKFLQSSAGIVHWIRPQPLNSTCSPIGRYLSCCHSMLLNPLNPKLNPICYLLALLARHFLHVSRIRVKSLTIRLLMSYIYGAPILMFLDHTWRCTTVGRTPLDEWSARRRDLYLTTHDTHNRQISMPPVGFEPTISAAAGRSPAEIVGSNPTGGMDICLLWVSCVVR